ncbi:MAG: transposase, partial [Alloacidobacterium sp.]
MAKRRVGKYPLSFRQMEVEQMKDCPSVSALAKELGIDRSNLYQWQRQLEHAGESSARVTSPVRELRTQVRELKRVLAEFTNRRRNPGARLTDMLKLPLPLIQIAAVDAQL